MDCDPESEWYPTLYTTNRLLLVMVERIVCENIVTLHYRIVRKIVLLSAVLFALGAPVMGRFLIGGLSFRQMLEQADVVVVATVVSTHDTPEKKRLIDIDTPRTARPELLHDAVVGVETEFRTRAVLKGATNLERFVLHHYRLAETDVPGYGAPNFIDVDPERHATYLMFLRRETDGRYAPVTGQFDPAVLSVFEIKEGAPDKIL